MVELLPLVFIAFLALSHVCGSFVCPKDCNCSTSNEKYEMFCAHNWNSTNDWQVEEIMFRDSLKLSCKDEIPSEDVYNWLDKRKAERRQPILENIRVVTMSNCPLPPNAIPLKDVLGLGNNVKKLYFKSCSGQNFHKGHFTGLNESLTHLSLIKCSIHSLAADVFEELGSQLEELDLRENLLEAVPSASLSPLKGLRYLELGNNNIKVITDKNFLNVSSLKFLNLWGNKNIQLFNGSLSGLKNLTSLDLGDCNITSLPNKIFSGLENLQNISLFANNFTTLPKELFSSTDLKVLKLFHNRQQLQIPEAFLAGLRNLKELHMQANGIMELPESLIWESPNISVFELQQNKLEHIPQLFLKNAGQLITLDLSENELEAIPVGLFHTPNKLKTVDLSYNRIRILRSGVLHGLHHISVLDLSHNQLSVIEPNAFPDQPPLTLLDLSHNKLKNLSAKNVNNGFGTWSVFNALSNLEELILSHNNIEEIYSDWRLNMLSLQKLDLSYNNVSILTLPDMQFPSGNVTVDLRYNNLRLVNLDELDITARYNSQKRPAHFLFQGNSIDCGCSSYDFLRYVHGSADPAAYKMLKIDADGVTCRTTKRPLSETSLHDVMCDDHCCLPPWQCKIRRSDYTWLLTCNGCWLNNERPPEPSKFKCMPRIRGSELHLHNNTFNSIPKEVLLSKLNITALHLSYNKLTELKASAITPALKKLEIDNNNFQNLDDEVVTMIQNSTQLQKITLHANPWKCDCETKKLLQFLQDEYTKVTDRRNIICSTGHSLAELTNDDLCPLPKMEIIISSVCLAVMGMTIGLLGFLYHRYQQDVKVWLYARNLCLWFVTEEELDRDKMYDAFVSYSHKDEDFVVEKLVAGLENGPVPFKLCLHYRDWIAGEWITEQIAKSIERSCRTLVVLSPNFLESVWGKMEFRAAHRKALSEGRARVIVVVYGEIGDVEKLDPELKAYLSTNTYVKWGDPWFWDKLRYALPHSQKFQGATRNRTMSDKMELIVSATPSPLVTPTTDITNPMEKQRHCNVNGYNNGAFVQQ